MQLTSSPRRALGLLAAGTIGLSTALRRRRGGGARPLRRPVPRPPAIDAVEAPDDGRWTVFIPDRPTDGAYPDAASPGSTPVDGGTTFGDAPDAGFLATATTPSSTLDGLHQRRRVRGRRSAASTRAVDPVDRSDDESRRPSGPGARHPVRAHRRPRHRRRLRGRGIADRQLDRSHRQGTYATTGYEVVAAGLPRSLALDDVDRSDSACGTTAALTCTATVLPGWKYTVLVSTPSTPRARGSARVRPSASTTVAVPALDRPRPRSRPRTRDLTPAAPAPASSRRSPARRITVSGHAATPRGSTVTLAIYSDAPGPDDRSSPTASGNFTATRHVCPRVSPPVTTRWSPSGVDVPRQRPLRQPGRRRSPPATASREARQHRCRRHRPGPRWHRHAGARRRPDRTVAPPPHGRLTARPRPGTRSATEQVPGLAASPAPTSRRTDATCPTPTSGTPAPLSPDAPLPSGEVGGRPSRRSARSWSPSG